MFKMETPAQLYGNIDQYQVRKNGCPKTKEEMLRTKEFSRINDKQRAATLSRDELCRALLKIARTPDGQSGHIELHEINENWKAPPAIKPLPINMSISNNAQNQLICHATQRPLPPSRIIFLGPYARGSTGFCRKRSVVIEYMTSVTQAANDGNYYTKLDPTIHYWISLPDAQFISDPNNIAFGVSERLRLPDGSVIGSLHVLNGPADISRFLSRQDRILPSVAPVTNMVARVNNMTKPRADVLTKRRPDADGTPRDLPISLDPKNHENKICYNEISYISREDWADETATDRVAIYPSTVAQASKLKAHCYVRSYVVQALNSAPFYRWAGEDTTYGSVDLNFPLYRLPNPIFLFDANSIALLQDKSVHSYLMKKLEMARVGTLVNNNSMYTDIQNIYTLIPLRSRADLIREFSL
jgi:hypothetical protein